MTNPRVVIERKVVDGKLTDILDEDATEELRNSACLHVLLSTDVCISSTTLKAMSSGDQWRKNVKYELFFIGSMLTLAILVPVAGLEYT